MQYISMISTRKLLLFVSTFLALAAGAFAQEPSPREQLQAAVAAYQKTPTHESALKVIELYKQLDPSPAVPEEARRPFVMGVTILKEATDPTGAAKAVELFTQAVRIAPWWAEASYNRAIANEAAGQFDAAIKDLTLYLASNLKEDERREAQDKIYALEAKAQLAADKRAEEQKAAAAKAAADTPQARETALLQKTEGTRFIDHHTPGNSGIPGQTWDEIFEIKNRTLLITAKIFLVTNGDIYGHRQSGEFLVDRIAYQNGEFTRSYNGFTTLYRIKPDGRALIRIQSGYQSELARY